MPYNRADYADDWDDIRLLVYQRDSYRCVDCGATGVTLAASHNCHDTQCRKLTHIWTRCNGCHLAKDRVHHAKNARATARKKRERGKIFDATFTLV